MELIEEFELRLELEHPVTMVGDSGAGIRVFGHVTGGTLTGARLRGDVLPGGGDWMIVDSRGYARPDVRVQVRVDGGAVIYVNYTGLLEMTAATQAALDGGGATSFEDQYLRSHVRIEAGGKDYVWLNQALFVGEGRLDPGPVAVYRIFRLS
jgi:hypothetical protein